MLTQQWLQQAPGGYWLLKDGQTHFGWRPTIETGHYNLLAVAGLSHKKTKHSNMAIGSCVPLRY